MSDIEAIEMRVQGGKVHSWHRRTLGVAGGRNPETGNDWLLRHGDCYSPEKVDFGRTWEIILKCRVRACFCKFGRKFMSLN